MELKFFDTANSFSFDATGEVPATGQLNLVPQDVTQTGRIGRQITIKKIHMKGNILDVPAAAATNATNVCLYLILDRQCNKAAAAITDVLTSTGITTAFRNLSNSDRFRVLHKFYWTMKPRAGVTTAYNNDVRHYNYKMKCNIPIDFTGSSGAIGTITSNNVFLLAGTDGNSDDIVTLTGSTRIRFTD